MHAAIVSVSARAPEAASCAAVVMWAPGTALSARPAHPLQQESLVFSTRGTDPEAELMWGQWGDPVSGVDPATLRNRSNFFTPVFKIGVGSSDTNRCQILLRSLGSPGTRSRTKRASSASGEKLTSEMNRHLCSSGHKGGHGTDPHQKSDTLIFCSRFGFTPLEGFDL